MPPADGVGASIHTRRAAGIRGATFSSSADYSPNGLERAVVEEAPWKRLVQWRHLERRLCVLRKDLWYLRRRGLLWTAGRCGALLPWMEGV